MSSQQLRARVRRGRQLRDGSCDPSSRLLDSSRCNGDFSLGEVVVQRAFGRTADIGDVVEASAGVALLPKQRHCCIYDGLSVLWDGGHEGHSGETNFDFDFILSGLLQPVNIE